MLISFAKVVVAGDAAIIPLGGVAGGDKVYPRPWHLD
jgi:hypothetical protein